MYPDDDVFLSPESIIRDVLASESSSDPTAELDFDTLSGTDWGAAPELD